MPVATPPLTLREPLLRAHWQATDPGLDQALSAMDRTETWVLDGDLDVAEALYAWTRRLHVADPQRLLHHLDDLLDLMAYLSSSRAMRLLQFFDEHCGPMWADALLKKARERVAATLDGTLMVDSGGQVMMDRLATLDAMALVGRLFAPERLQAVRAVLAADTAR